MTEVFMRYLALSTLFFLASCGTPPPASTPKITIDFPPPPVDKVDNLTQVIKDLKTLTTDPKTTLTTDVFFTMLRIPEEIEPYVKIIKDSREKTIEITCDASGLRCVGRSLGNKKEFKIETISIPVLGKPWVKLAETIEVYFSISEDHQRAEICRLNGVKVRVKFVSQNIDGALLVFHPEKGVDTLKLDVGPGGDYPHEGCHPEKGA